MTNLVLRTPPSMDADLNTLHKSSSDTQCSQRRDSDHSTEAPAVSAKVHFFASCSTGCDRNRVILGYLSVCHLVCELILLGLESFIQNY